MSIIYINPYAFAAAGIVTSGLVLNLDAGDPASYPGSGTTWTDLSGNGNTGTLTNGPTYSSADGGSILFDGVNDFAQINNPTSFQNQNFTISIWVKPGTQDPGAIIMIDFDHASNHGWVVQTENPLGTANYYLVWGSGSGFQPAGGFGSGIGIQTTNSVWQNIVYSKNGTSLLGYSNGSQAFTPPAASTSTVGYQSNKNLRIAGGVSAALREFTGNISQVSIYDRALSATEITQNFNALRGRYGL
jgi:hypothetical protein